MPGIASQDREAALNAVDVIVTGAGGRVGRLLRRAWELTPPPGLRPVWSGRRGGFDLEWDILAGPVPVFPRGAVVLHLAGAVGGGAEALHTNADMVTPVLRACRQNGAAALLVASTAAVYAPGPAALDEETPPDPRADYGRSKLEMERRLALDAGDLPVTCLRIGNVVGAESLLGPRPNDAPIRLDPVPGRSGGPVRSWIGPRGLAGVLARLCRLSLAGGLPRLVNVAAEPPLAMADLLDASGRSWSYGPPNPAVVPSAMMETARLRSLCDLPAATPAALLAELRTLEEGAQ